jgi:hypothetical protein
MAIPQLVTACRRLRQHTDWDTETTATAASLRAWPAASNSWTTRPPSTPRPSPPWSGPGGLSCSPNWRGPDRGRIGAVRLVPCWPLPLRRRLRDAGRAAPIPASSGQTMRYRLNRSGDRQLNQALHVVVMTRLRTDPATQAYAERRRAQGKTNREIKRCLVRYVARQLYRLLEAAPALDPT